MAKPVTRDRDTRTESRLARWSQRKIESRSAAPGPGGAPQPDSGEDLPEARPPTALEPGGVPAVREGAEPSAPDLPPVESLDSESDYTGFLADGVPEELTRAALQRLWRSDPVFANLDGLNDYDEDFSIITPIARAVGEALAKGDDAPPAEERSTPRSGGEAAEDDRSGVEDVGSAEDFGDETPVEPGLEDDDRPDGGDPPGQADRGRDGRENG